MITFSRVIQIHAKFQLNRTPGYGENQLVTFDYKQTLGQVKQIKNTNGEKNTEQ